MLNNLPIGVFDSGIGGLTVYRKLREMLPRENIIYFGDTGRTPYGSRPKEQVYQFVDEIMKFMSLCNIKLGVVACNSITVLGVDTLCKDYNFNLVGNSLGASTALRVTKRKRIGVIATETTVRSGKHSVEISRLDPKAEVFAQACPKLASLVEAGNLNDSEIKDALNMYLLPLMEQNIDTLILGCTHYSYVSTLIQEIMGKSVTIVDPATETAETVRDVLRSNHWLNVAGGGISRLYFSAAPEHAKFVASSLLDTRDLLFEHLDLTTLATYCNRYRLYDFGGNNYSPLAV
jgi:glutamate racemase